MHDQSACAQRAPDRSKKSIVAGVARCKTGLAPRVHKAQSHRLRRRLRGNRSLQQVRMEWQHRNTVPRGSLRKHSQDITGLQTLGQMVHHAQGIAR